jgi:hypothetical protein
MNRSPQWTGIYSLIICLVLTCRGRSFRPHARGRCCVARSILVQTSGRHVGRPPYPSAAAPRCRSPVDPTARSRSLAPGPQERLGIGVGHRSRKWARAIVVNSVPVSPGTAEMSRTVTSTGTQQLPSRTVRNTGHLGSFRPFRAELMIRSSQYRSVTLPASTLTWASRPGAGPRLS